MKTLKIMPIYIMLVITILTLLVAVTFGYAFFDKLSKSESPTVQIGSWDTQTVFLEYFTGFESYTGGEGDKDLDGRVWNLKKVSLGNGVNNNFNGTKSLRGEKNTQISSNSGFKGAQSISFYLGKAKNSSGTGNGYTVTITINGVTYEIASADTNPAVFSKLYFDISYIYSEGIGGTVFPINAEVFFKIVISNGGQNYSNIDDIKILYRP